MATTITWTDNTGAASLSNGKPVPADRFTSWAPRTIPVNDRAWGLGTGALHTFEHRVDYGVSFELRGIPHTSMALMERCVRWLAQGGTVTVNTGDAGARSYVAGLAPDAELPHPELTDAPVLEYAMRFELISQAATPAPMLCIYP